MEAHLGNLIQINLHGQIHTQRVKTRAVNQNPSRPIRDAQREHHKLCHMDGIQYTCLPHFQLLNLIKSKTSFISTAKTLNHHASWPT